MAEANVTYSLAGLPRIGVDEPASPSLLSAMPPATARFPFTTESLSLELSKAVGSYWRARGRQGKKQKVAKSRESGTRGEVLGGQHLDGIAHLLVQVARAAGFKQDEITRSSKVELPGYFRATKKWDIVVTRNNRLCAAIELKSQVGPSFGNNFNNRTEEAIGSSTDFWVAYREGALGSQLPWLGYLLLVEDAPKSNSMVRLSKSLFPPMDVFLNTSYMDRYAILCERLVLERQYSAATLLSSPRSQNGTYAEPRSALNFETFSKSLFGHLVGASLDT